MVYSYHIPTLYMLFGFGEFRDDLGLYGDEIRTHDIHVGNVTLYHCILPVLAKQEFSAVCKAPNMHPTFCPTRHKLARCGKWRPK
jgi:hypothetical protein